jgi:hypothetical protein
VGERVDQVRDIRSGTDWPARCFGTPPDCGREAKMKIKTKIKAGYIGEERDY